MEAVRRVASAGLRPDQVDSLRALFAAAWAEEGGFTEDDWEHAFGGVHFLLEKDGVIVAHASVIERQISIGGRQLRTGYVEAVATRPGHQRRGYGSAVMREVAGYVDDIFQLGALDTGKQAFYERLGWVVWKGPTAVRTERGPVRTPEDDGNVMIRPTPSSPPLDPVAPITCEWRRGDVW